MRPISYLFFVTFDPLACNISEKSNLSIIAKGARTMKTDISDQVLYQDFLAGDLSAFDSIMSKYRTCLICFIQNYVKNWDVAEDLAQDVFVYLLVKKEPYDFKYSMKTYLFTIGKSRAINYLKKEKHIPLEDYHLTDHPSALQNQIEEAVLTEERKQLLYQAIAQLKPSQRAAVFLADIEGLSTKELCKTLKKSPSQAKMILYRARKNLRKILEKEGLTNE